MGNNSITPALTMCAIDPGIQRGWKYDIWFERRPKLLKLDSTKKKSWIQKHSDLINFCNGTTNLQDCVEKNTYNLEETLDRASAKSPEGNINFKNSTNWTREMFFKLGTCHTFNKTIPLDSVGQWMVEFHKQFDFNLIIHDPNYFMITTNPATIPSIMINFQAEDLGRILTYIEAIRHINIDRPDQPCNVQGGYSFTACIKNSLSSMVGCR